MKKVFSSVLTIFILSAIFSSHVISWGLTHQKKGWTPQVPDFAQGMLEDNNGIFLGDKQKNIVYLTFDLGYEAGYTMQVLDILAKHKIKAIFFLCGNYLKEDKIIDKMIADGHIIGNHTDNHLDLPKQSDQDLKKDIEDFSQKFNEKFTHSIKHFRPPHGRFDERVLKCAHQNGLKTVLWSNAIADWSKKPIDPSKCSDKLLGRLHSGSIILLHITNAGTPKMLELLIPQIVSNGFEIGDATQL
ncbi:MAG: polysaccharide deacetylase family protein [Clostridiales bacterium]|jgi:peptidoglycan-N-acetylmuramic acid deacetylase|nr:polysaccharide deacetylase family protein [Clostridiales bacterium]